MKSYLYPYKSSKSLTFCLENLQTNSSIFTLSNVKQQKQNPSLKISVSNITTKNENSKDYQHSNSKDHNMTFSTKLCSLFLLASIFIQGSLAELVCEHLPTEVCVLAISSSGKRCVLEKYKNEVGETEYQCSTSEVVVGRMSEYIETDECVKACGVDRKMVGISSDNLLEPRFTSKLCSPACFKNCPNIIDLYFKLAEGEGVYLPELCKKQQRNPRRAMVELMSSGAAPGPISSAALSSSLAEAPAPAPVSSFI